jgi:hypothetical protein
MDGQPMDNSTSFFNSQPLLIEQSTPSHLFGIRADAPGIQGLEANGWSMVAVLPAIRQQRQYDSLRIHGIRQYYRKTKGI